MKRFLCFLLMFPLLAGCVPQQTEQPGTFYYLRQETVFSGTNGVIAPEERGLTDDLLELVNQYCEGPLDSHLRSPLPPNCRVLSVELGNDALSLHFDERLSQLSGIELTLAASCLARTFLNLTGAKKLHLTAENARLNGRRVVTLTLEELDLQDNSLDRLHGTFSLYYADRDRRYLIRQEMSMNMADQENPKLYLLQQLLHSPTGLRSPLPSGVQIHSVTMDGSLCTVDLGVGFLSNRFPNPRAQLLSLMSMVSTLTSLSDVERVEFTVDGDLLIRYGDISITEPLQRDSRLFGPVREALGEVEHTIYLLHGEERLLMAVPTRLRSSGSKSDAELIIDALLRDTGINGISTGIPSGTELLDLELANGICRVNLSGAYLQSSERLQFCNRVIAASLLKLNSISRVEILVDGAIPPDFPEEKFVFSWLDPNWFL